MIATTELTCDELLTTTRNVRRWLDLTAEVDLELVKDCLRVALQAPNGGNRQGWRWIVLTDTDRRAQLAEIYRNAFYERNGAPLDATDEATQRMMTSARALADNLARVPVLVIPCLQLESAHLAAGNQASTWASLLPAAWSYMLAARSRGLATAWTTAHLHREREAAELLGLPPTVHQGGLIPTARSLKSTFGPARRRPLEEVLHINGWQGEVG